MIKRLIIPLYNAEVDFFENKMKEYRGVKTTTAFSLIKSGIEHWREDVSFKEYISVPTYPASCKVGHIALDLDTDCDEWRIIDEIHRQQQIPRSKVARFFMLYDWRFCS